MVIAVVSLFIGFVIGMFLGISKITRRHASGVQGVLNVDSSDPTNEPGLWLQLNVPIEDVVSQRQAIFNVNVIQPISQK